MSTKNRVFTLLLTIIIGACSSVTTRTTTQPSSENSSENKTDVIAGDNLLSASQLFATWSARILNAKFFRVKIKSTASGAVNASFTGSMQSSLGNQFDLNFNGQFRDKPMRLRMQGDGVTLSRANGQGSDQIKMPVEANRAIRIGLLRMGLMHNLAGLTGLRGPDHADGLADKWVQAERFREQPIEGAMVLTNARSVSYDVRTSGQIVGESTLWFDAGGILVRREIVVHFKTQDMRVIETYEKFEFE